MKTKEFFRTAWRWLLAATVLVVLVFALEGRQPRYKSVSQYATTDIVYADGETAHINNLNFGVVNKGDVVTIHLRLPEQAYFNRSTLVFYDYNTTTEVWLGDILLESYGQDIAAKGMMIGNHDFFVYLPDNARGQEITIVLRITENNALSSFPSLNIYPAESAEKIYIDRDPVGFLVSLTLFVFGVIGLLAFAFGKTDRPTFNAGLSLSVAALLFSLWMIANKGIYNLMGLSYYFWQPLEYMTGYALPIPLLLFLANLTGTKKKWKKRLRDVAAIETGFVVIATVLNFSGVAHFDAMMAVAGIIEVFSGGLMAGYVFSIKPGRSSTNILLRVATVFFLATCFYELIIRNLDLVLSWSILQNLPSLMPIGILLLVVCMIEIFCTELFYNQKNLITMQVKADTLGEVMEATPAGICQMIPDEALTIVSANDLFYKIMGYGDSELKNGKPEKPITRLNAEEQAFFRKKMADIVKGTEDSGEFEFSETIGQNKRRMFLARYFYDRAGSGNITVNLLDISERKQMENELRLSRQRYRLAMEQSGKQFFSIDVPKRTMYIPKKLADAIGLPQEVDNVPDNPLLQNLVEPESLENYRAMYEKILSGEQQGEVVIACHWYSELERLRWSKMSFVSILDENKTPDYAIVTCEDVTEQFKAELSSRWKMLDIAQLPESKYEVLTFDLTLNCLQEQTGGLFVRLPQFVSTLEEANAFATEQFLYTDDRDACRAFFDRERLLSLYRAGQSTDSIEYRSTQHDSDFRWTRTTATMIEAPYHKHIMLQLVFVDIHDQKSGEIQMQYNMEALQKELDNSRIRIMINQMQPHFLYNALSAIQTIVKFDPDYAYQLIYDFTIHLRSSIKALSSDAPIPFTDEMENVKAYLNIEKMRFFGNINIVYQLECEDFSVIPLTIQPLAENAARHGLYPKGDEGGTIWIRSREDEDSYIVEVEDNGEGFDVQKALDQESDSIGLKNLIYRLKVLMDAEVLIESKIGSGTLARVTIPKKRKEVE